MSETKAETTIDYWVVAFEVYSEDDLARVINTLMEDDDMIRLHGVKLIQQPMTEREMALSKPPTLPTGITRKPTPKAKAPRGRKAWSPEDVAFLKANPDMSHAELAQYLDRTPAAVQWRRWYYDTQQ